MKVFQLCGIGRECPKAMPHERPFCQSSKSRWFHPAPNQECGAFWRRLSRTSYTAVITTKSKLAPTLARHQMAKMVAVIMTICPMPALARHQMAEEPAIITLAVIMITHPMPALVRLQPAKESATSQCDPTLKVNKTPQSINPTPETHFTEKEIPISGNGHQCISKNLA
jgi:hypothetical protein